MDVYKGAVHEVAAVELFFCKVNVFKNDSVEVRQKFSRACSDIEMLSADFVKITLKNFRYFTTSQNSLQL